MRAWSGLIFSILFATACDSSSGGPPTGAMCPSPATTTSTGATGAAVPLTWDNFGQDFMTSNCTRCHGTFRSVTGVRASLAAIDAYSAAGPDAINRDMPPSGGLSDEERQLLGEWLACGAP